MRPRAGPWLKTTPCRSPPGDAGAGPARASHSVRSSILTVIQEKARISRKEIAYRILMVCWQRKVSAILFDRLDVAARLVARGIRGGAGRGPGAARDGDAGRVSKTPRGERSLLAGWVLGLGREV